MNRWLCGLAAGAMMTMSVIQAAEYFVDSQAGDDSNSGLSVTEPWQFVRRVNQAQLQPGDTVRFKAGTVWRESLTCRSGAEGRPVTYTSYGTGPKPALLASVDLCSRDAWVSDGGNIWRTREDTMTGSRPFPSFAPGDWGIYCDGDGLATLAAITNDQDEKVYSLRCLKNGERSTNIQLNYYGIELEPEQCIRYRFRAKATTPFTIKSITLMRAQHPWGNYGVLVNRATDITTEWQEHDVLFRTTITEPAADGRLSFFVGDAITEGNELSFVSLGAELVDYQSLGLTSDVGNLVLITKGQSEKIAGWKRWNRVSLKRQGDFFHDPSDRRLYVYSEQHPVDVYSQIEAAMKRVIVRFGKTAHAIVDGLTIAYTGAHGANGNGCRHGTIRNCDLVWIGGSHLYTRNDRPTRYGNGVEFWDGCENMTVEDNYFENIYDTAMTNQGRGDGSVRNMVWRNNKIFRCEQAYEIWFSNPEMHVDGLSFTGNECIDSGYGWGHVQRPNKNGCHLLAYKLACKITGIRYEHNIFNNARDAQIWFFNPRLAEVRINHNAYIQTCPVPRDAKLFRWLGVAKEGVTFDEYRKATGNDQDSSLD
ncbi:MAG: right-handed parallel beta-helix repeat-containing protein [Lentisphaerae bacterium]|nr:right-handed parallel beta-helix repeat-containing protein [Lentisphaerota bacterium]MBT4814449.1 right-handed parallel beta-helix repeat-containing protein [Lentisphaerota bacterium]MBT5608856.1 right-handed parallel beta-helix repeat-containing protein [Lentisphaerota bacterium]MBT7845063.1 right-handed parallel beta-helix repeat-containing protein [Lentisphaerota bacterium]